MDGRFDAVENRRRVGKRLDGVDYRLAGVKKRLDSVDARLDGLEVPVQALEGRALDTEPTWEPALAEILPVRRGVDDLNAKSMS